MNEHPPPAQFQAALLDGVRHFAPTVRSIAAVQRLSGGASQETWSLVAQFPEHEARLVLRRAPGPRGNRSTASLPLAIEADVIARAREVGVPVPTVRLVLPDGHALGEGFFMDWLEGETLPARIFRTAALQPVLGSLAFECGGVLARIHRARTAGLEALRVAPAQVEVAHYREAYRRFDTPRPVFDWALRWLAENLPAPLEGHPPVLVHGDFRNGNLLITPAGLGAVLDWELAHLGDPMEDLGWFCVNSWRFGRLDHAAGGFGTRQALFDGYEAGGGGRVQASQVRFWEVLGTLKWGVMCLQMLDAWRTGLDRSVERAAIGRRASETEIDLLRLLAPRGQD